MLHAGACADAAQVRLHQVMASLHPRSEHEPGQVPTFFSCASLLALAFLESASTPAAAFASFALRSASLAAALAFLASLAAVLAACTTVLGCQGQKTAARRAVCGEARAQARDAWSIAFLAFFSGSSSVRVARATAAAASPAGLPGGWPFWAGAMAGGPGAAGSVRWQWRRPAPLGGAQRCGEFGRLAPFPSTLREA